MQLTCPCCHARVPLQAVLEQDACRELLTLLVEHKSIARLLVGYLGFFRAEKTQLGWERAVRLARETIGLAGETNAGLAALEEALQETTAVLADKRAQGGWKPLTNHNYLRRVLESTTARAASRAAPSAGESPASRAPTSKAGQALVTLERMKRGG